MPRPLSRRAPSILYALGLATATAVALIAARAAARNPSDDAWISFRYAWNLVHGDGLVWNAGAEPVEGYSNLAWTLWAAVGILLGVPVAPWATTSGLILGVGTVLATAAAVRAVGGGRIAAVLAALLAASSPLAALWSTQGLETPLLAFLLTAGTAAAAWEAREARLGRRRRPWSVLPFAIAAITRPEAPVFLAVPVLIRLARLRVDPLRRSDGLAFAALTAPFVAQHAFRLWFYGSLVPHTYYVKVDAEDLLSEGLYYALAWLAYDPVQGGLWVVGGLLAVIGGRGALWLVPIAGTVATVAVGGDGFANLRFLVPLAPLLSAAALAGLDGLAGRLPRWGTGVVLAAAAVVVTGTVPRQLAIREVIRAQHPDPGIVRIRTRPLGKLLESRPRIADGPPAWIVEVLLERVPPGGAFLFSDVGAVGYAVVDAHLLDGRGLSWPAAADVSTASLEAAPRGLDDPAVQTFLQELHASRPQLLFLQCHEGALFGPPEAILQSDHRFQAEYTFWGQGPYFGGMGLTCAYLRRDAKPLDRDLVIARYERVLREMPGIFDLEGRLAELREGATPASPPQAGTAPSLPRPGVYVAEARKPPRYIAPPPGEEDGPKGPASGEGAPSGSAPSTDGGPKGPPPPGGAPTPSRPE